MTHRSIKRTSYLLMLLFLFTLIAAACGGGDQEVAAPAAREQPTAAPTDTPAAVDTSAVDTIAPISETAPVTETALVSETAPISEPAPATDSPTGARTFVIDQSQSEARFTLDEMLMGQPKIVVGVTKLIDGSITLDPADLTKTTLSPLQIDARDFTTDSGMRNTAIRRFVLQSNRDEYRYIVFTPTALEGLPARGNAGDTLNFQITGDLTISGVTKPVTFATTVSAESASRLSGLAKTQVLRSDFNLNLPNVPGVADVTDAVQLELQFVATAQSVTASASTKMCPALSIITTIC